MSQPETLPAPVVPAVPENKWRREQHAFRQALPVLLKIFRDQYVAIHEGTVVEFGPDQAV